MRGRLARQTFAAFGRRRNGARPCLRQQSPCKDKVGVKLAEDQDKDNSWRTNNCCAEGWRNWMDQANRFYISTKLLYFPFRFDGSFF